MSYLENMEIEGNHPSLSLRLSCYSILICSPSSISLSSTPSHRFLFHLGVRNSFVYDLAFQGLEKPYHCMGSSNRFRSTPMVDLKGKGILYEEDDEPILLFD
ncbi:hypothetical protein YC2023_105835 [Brassica napus]